MVTDNRTHILEHRLTANTKIADQSVHRRRNVFLSLIVFGIGHIAADIEVHGKGLGV